MSLGWFLLGFAAGWIALGLFLTYIEAKHHWISGRSMEDPPDRVQEEGRS